VVGAGPAFPRLGILPLFTAYHVVVYRARPSRNGPVERTTVDESTQKRLRVKYHTFRRHHDQFVSEMERRHDLLPESIIKALEDDVAEVELSAPNLLPRFDRRGAERTIATGRIKYRTEVVLTYLNRVVSILEAELETRTTIPVTEHREFSFVHDAKVRAIVERDYAELQAAFLVNCWKSVIILCGGAIEAVLLGLLQQNDARALAAASAPKQKDLSDWSLSDLIHVGVELKLVTEGVEKLSHSVREYRNLVHPGNEIKSALSFGKEEARIAVEVLHIIHRDQS